MKGRRERISEKHHLELKNISISIINRRVFITRNGIEIVTDMRTDTASFS